MFWVGPLPALVGNNRVYREWGVLVSYYLPGNSLAPPPSHRASGATAQVVEEHAILGSVIFHPTWAVAEWWSTLILPVCDPPQPVCGHYNDALQGSVSMVVPWSGGAGLLLLG